MCGWYDMMNDLMIPALVFGFGRVAGGLKSIMACGLIYFPYLPGANYIPPNDYDYMIEDDYAYNYGVNHPHCTNASVAEKYSVLKSQALEFDQSRKLDRPEVTSCTISAGTGCGSSNWSRIRDSFFSASLHAWWFPWPGRDTQDRTDIKTLKFRMSSDRGSSTLCGPGLWDWCNSSSRRTLAAGRPYERA